jgi:predicted enzyme related to lactoylglutathione lyase
LTKNITCRINKVLKEKAELLMIIIEKMYNISLSVSDIEKSITFYKDILGFDIVEKQSGSDEAILQMGEIVLRLCQISSLPELMRIENYVTFYVDDDDFDDALEEIEENKIDIIYGPENIRNGRNVIITDIDGNRIGLCSVSK